MKLAGLFVLVSLVAQADDAKRVPINIALLRKAFTDGVQTGPMLFDDEACATRFGAGGKVTGADLDALVGCMPGLVPVGQTDEWRIAGSRTATTKGSAITELAPIAATAKDASLATVDLRTDTKDFTPSDAARTKVDAAKHAEAVAKVCLDDKGAATSHRIIHGSGIASYDADVDAYLAKRSWKAVTVFGTPAALCPIVFVRYPYEARDAEIDALPLPRNAVPPTQLETNRIAGDRAIVPDDATKRKIQKDGKDRVVGSFKLCLDELGQITLVKLLKSTGYIAYDDKLKTTMETTWKYKPFEVDGVPAPVCTAVTFIYTQKAAAP